MNSRVAWSLSTEECRLAEELGLGLACASKGEASFFGGVFEEGVKNFVTVWTLLDFSFVFLSSNLLKGVMVDCDWAF